MFRQCLFKRVMSLRRLSSQSFKSASSGKKIDVGKYVLLSIPLGTFGLGTWQVQRRKWKLNLIAELQEKCKRTPVDLIENLGNLEKLEYCPVHVRGHFQHHKEVYIGPRSLVDRNQSSSMISLPAPHGYYVVTPFKLIDKDMVILVNRGWVQRSQKLPASRKDGQVQGVIDLVGTVRRAEAKPLLADTVYYPGSKVFHYRDIDGMAAKCDASPVYIDANLDSTIPGGPIGGQTRFTLRNQHLSYIVTWYLLSAATGYMWYLKYIQRFPLL